MQESRFSHTMFLRCLSVARAARLPWSDYLEDAILFHIPFVAARGPFFTTSGGSFDAIFEHESSETVERFLSHPAIQRAVLETATGRYVARKLREEAFGRNLHGFGNPAAAGDRKAFPVPSAIPVRFLECQGWERFVTDPSIFSCESLYFGGGPMEFSVSFLDAPLPMLTVSDPSVELRWGPDPESVLRFASHAPSGVVKIPSKRACILARAFFCLPGDPKVVEDVPHSCACGHEHAADHVRTCAHTTPHEPCTAAVSENETGVSTCETGTNTPYRTMETNVPAQTFEKKPDIAETEASEGCECVPADEKSDSIAGLVDERVFPAKADLDEPKGNDRISASAQELENASKFEADAELEYPFMPDVHDVPEEPRVDFLVPDGAVVFDGESGIAEERDEDWDDPEGIVPVPTPAVSVSFLDDFDDLTADSSKILQSEETDVPATNLPMSEGRENQETDVLNEIGSVPEPAVSREDKPEPRSSAKVSFYDIHEPGSAPVAAPLSSTVPNNWFVERQETPVDALVMEPNLPDTITGKDSDVSADPSESISANSEPTAPQEPLCTRTNLEFAAVSGEEISQSAIEKRPVTQNEDEPAVPSEAKLGVSLGEELTVKTESATLGEGPVTAEDGRSEFDDLVILRPAVTLPHSQSDNGMGGATLAPTPEGLPAGVRRFNAPGTMSQTQKTPISSDSTPIQEETPHEQRKGFGSFGSFGFRK